MKMKVGDGSLTKWFENVSNDELILISLMSAGAMQRLCMLLSLEYQMLKEKS